jgi:hypothetical protein
VTRAKRKNSNRAGTDARKRNDGRYETRATLNTPTGRRRVSFYGDTAAEANNKKFQALADQASGVLFTDPGQLKVGEYLQAWLYDTARYQVSESSFERYERTCRVHLVPFFGHVRLRALTAAHVRAFKARKLEEGLHPNTVGGMHKVLSGALNQAVRDGLIPANPAAHVKKAAARGERPMRSLSLEEASRPGAAQIDSNRRPTHSPTGPGGSRPAVRSLASRRAYHSSASAAPYCSAVREAAAIRCTSSQFLARSP